MIDKVDFQELPRRTSGRPFGDGALDLESAIDCQSGAPRTTWGIKLENRVAGRRLALPHRAWTSTQQRAVISRKFPKSVVSGRSTGVSANGRFC